MTFGLWPGVEVYFETGRDPVAYVFEHLPSEGPVTMRKAEADRRIELKEYSYARIEEEFAGLGLKLAPPNGWNSKNLPEFFNAQTNPGVNWEESFGQPDIQVNPATKVQWDIRPPKAEEL